jgi:hypothetical protein
MQLHHYHTGYGCLTVYIAMAGQARGNKKNLEAGGPLTEGTNHRGSRVCGQYQSCLRAQQLLIAAGWQQPGNQDAIARGCAPRIIIIHTQLSGASTQADKTRAR